jgi:hypothetical protein
MVGGCRAQGLGPGKRVFWLVRWLMFWLNALLVAEGDQRLEPNAGKNVQRPTSNSTLALFSSLITPLPFHHPLPISSSHPFYLKSTRKRFFSDQLTSSCCRSTAEARLKRKLITRRRVQPPHLLFLLLLLVHLHLLSCSSLLAQSFEPRWRKRCRSLRRPRRYCQHHGKCPRDHLSPPSCRVLSRRLAI